MQRSDELAVQSMTVLFQTYSLSQLPPAHLPLFFSQSVSLCYTSTADVSLPSLCLHESSRLCDSICGEHSYLVKNKRVTSIDLPHFLYSKQRKVWQATQDGLLVQRLPHVIAVYTCHLLVRYKTAHLLISYKTAPIRPF